MSLQVCIITPKKQIFEDTADMVVIPSTDGELTILSHHVPLFTPLSEGIVEVKSSKDEHYFSIGGGYMETDGVKATILVTHASGQDEIDEKAVKQAQDKARTMITEAKTDEDRNRAHAMLRRSVIDARLLAKLHIRH